ncbi:hypothetical protein [Carboxylicivirga sp. M1479]|uniref:hypothetical protein n=1 Tax=Carboxylicivirga sp. M1479 TaxID=2594476 RepID=UPI0011775401|nr:hypothetical protein [Carboxylicivirga sp. M1479]TRX72413.1 hypothetical protein FNN09_00290 [Carboxylicivirga sp. M1479]
MLKSTVFIALIILLSSCCQIITSLINNDDDYSNCDVIEQSELHIKSPGNAVLTAIIKNNGELSVYDVEVVASLKKNDVVLERQRVVISYLSVNEDEMVSFSFTQVNYGNEYDQIDISMHWKEVASYDDNDNGCDG